MLWKNGVAQTLSDEFSAANSVYVSGTDVYVGGGSNSTTPLYPAIWKNGTIQKLNTRSGQANSVFVSGTDVYAVGSRSGPTLWKNGVEQTLDANTTNNTTARSIFVEPK